jgi:glycerol-3-phosphate cytidylyltransferase
MKKYQRGIICGSFDLIHPGYIKMFRDAKSVCQKLTIALQGDPTIDRPEKYKPVQTITDRIEILGAVKYIDRVVVYNTEDDLDRLLGLEKYDVRILGTDYRNRDDYTGAHYNKPVYFHERNHEYSTTKLKKQIVESMKDR